LAKTLPTKRLARLNKAQPTEGRSVTRMPIFWTSKFLGTYRVLCAYSIF